MRWRCLLCRWLPCGISREDHDRTLALVDAGIAANREAAASARRAAHAQGEHQRRAAAVQSRVQRLSVVNAAKAKRVHDTLDELLRRVDDE